MKDLQDFLLRSSGADPAVLRKSPTDLNKYVGIGGTVLFTAILAFMAASYAAYTVCDSVILSLAFGVIWGLMIFNLDRYIVSSLKRRGSVWTDLIYALPRIAIAVVIALVISKPVELKLFEKEINSEISLIEQEVFLNQENAVKLRFEKELESIEFKRLAVLEAIEEAEKQRTLKQNEAIAEADGTGGSRKKNLGPIYQLKKQEADKAEAEYSELTALSAIQLDELDQQTQAIKLALSNAILAIDRKPIDGLAYRMAALDRISQKFPPIQRAQLFIVFLFILIESAPVLVKLISPRSNYDYHLHVHEQSVEMYHKEVTAKRSNATEAAIRFDHDVTIYGIQGEIKVKRAQIDEEVRRKIGQIKERPEPI